MLLLPSRSPQPQLPLLPLLLLLCFAAFSAAYPSGAPAMSCLSLQPMHMQLIGKTKALYGPYTAKKLYTLTANATVWTPGQNVTVVLGVVGDEKFEGFILRATRATHRYTDMNLGPLLGTFACTNSMGAAMKYHAVFSPTNTTNCVTHASKKDYKNLTCVWTPPATNEGPVVFSATAVEEYEKYQHVMSDTLNSTMGDPSNVHSMGPLEQMPSLTGCGKTKTCALYPPLCDTRGGCTHAVMMTQRADSSLLFEMFGETTDWVGMGIGDSHEMVSMELYACTYSTTTRMVTLTTSYSPKEAVLEVYRPQVTMRKGMAVMNDSSPALPAQPTKIGCQFVRPKTETYTMYGWVNMRDVVMTMTSDLSAGKYMVLAQGNLIGPTSKMTGQHVFRPLMSPEKFVPGVTSKMFFGGLPKHVQIHGTLMTLYWMFLCGFAIIVARHSRPVFNQKLVMKKDLWFLLHVVCMIVGFVVGVAGFVYLLVFEGKWEKDSQTHGILGLIAMGLALINILAGVFRPSPDANYRWIFNRLHRYNGLLSLVFAAVAMWLGALMRENRPEFQLWAIIVLGVWTGLQLVFMIVFEVMRQSNVRNEEFSRAVEKKYSLGELDKDGNSVPQAPAESEVETLKGKKLKHVSSLAIIFYGLTLLALSAAFWAGLWMH